MTQQQTRWAVGVLGALGIATLIALHWMVFFWVPTESTMGVVQRIFYIHVPSWWIAFLGFGCVGLCSAAYLWLGDERLDRAAVTGAEAGMIFTTIGLLTGPLWARVAWGTWWEWEPRLTLALILWFIYLGYFLARNSMANPEQGKRAAAVIGIIGVLDIPLIHVSVTWLRSLHPEPVILTQDGLAQDLDSMMAATFGVSMLAFTLIFTSLFIARYTVAGYERELDLRDATPAGTQGATA
jgi:heme exporter protein C